MFMRSSFAALVPRSKKPARGVRVGGPVVDPSGVLIYFAIPDTAPATLCAW
jgi:hypothetical protein